MCTLGPNMLLYRAAAAHNLPVMCHAIAIGADKNWRNPNDNGQTCLFQAILSVNYIILISICVKIQYYVIILHFFSQGSVMACEYLILNASDINIQDFDGQTPLFFATQLGKF